MTSLLTNEAFKYPYSTQFYEFIKRMSFILADAVTEHCNFLNLKVIEDPEIVISPSYYSTHFLASLAGYKFI